MSQLELQKVDQDYLWSNLPDLNEIQSLSIHLIKDSMINVKTRNEYERDSFLFLVNAHGELSIWLDTFKQQHSDLIKERIYTFLESLPWLYMR